MKRQAGFTLIELVLVVAILGVLAMAALPKLFDVQLGAARDAAQEAVVGAVQTGISLYAANQVAQGNAISYPATLDAVAGVAGGVAASGTNAFFGNAIASPVTSGNWYKAVAGTNGPCYGYDSDSSGTLNVGDDMYEYNPAAAAGTFLWVTNAAIVCP